MERCTGFGRRLRMTTSLVAVLCASSMVLAVGSVVTDARTAGAAGPVGLAGGSGVTCSKLSGSASKTVTISKCAPSAGPGYGSASQPGGNFGVGVLTWARSGATTLGQSTIDLLETRGPCTGTSEEAYWTSTVAAASTSGPGIPAVGDPVSAYVCLHFTYSGGTEHVTRIALARGTKVHL